MELAWNGRILRSWTCAIVLLAAQWAVAAGPRVAFLLIPESVDLTEADTAYGVTARAAGATAIRLAGDGRFVDRAGREVSLQRFDVLWCHHWHTIQQADLAWAPDLVEQLKKHCSGGRGLLLTGGAASLVSALGLDTVRADIMTAGQDYVQAGLAPLITEHPAFRGLDLERGVLWMTGAAFPAFARFETTSQPPRGLLLARTPGGPEIRLVEYRLGQGRVVAMAWQIARLYDDAPADYRRDFEALAHNLVNYLGSPESRREWDKPTTPAPPVRCRRAMAIAPVGHRAFAAGPARGGEIGLAVQLLEQFQPAAHGLRQPDRGPFARPPGRQADDALPARGRTLCRRLEARLRRPATAVFDARLQRPLAGVRDRRRRLRPARAGTDPPAGRRQL